jgi:hypothetical protein
MMVRLRTVEKLSSSDYRLTLDLADEDRQAFGDCALRVDLYDGLTNHQSFPRGLLRLAFEAFSLAPSDPPTSTEARLLWEHRSSRAPVRRPGLRGRHPLPLQGARGRQSRLDGVMDTLEAAILASFLSDAQTRLASGERVSFHRLLARCGGHRLVRSWSRLLQGRELVVWVDDHAVMDVSSSILIARDSRLSITLGPTSFARLVTAAEAHASRWN